MEFLFTVPERFVFGGRLAPGVVGDWPVLYNFRREGVTSVIWRYMGNGCWKTRIFVIYYLLHIYYL